MSQIVGADTDLDNTIYVQDSPCHIDSDFSGLTTKEVQTYNLVYGLSQLGIGGDTVPFESAIGNSEGREHIDILNSLAFLLVFKPGERAAITYFFGSSSLRLLWAKDVDVIPEDLNYLDTIVQRIVAQK